jgi:hypothetical protein
LKFLIIESTASSSHCKNSFGKTIGAPKTDSAGERPLSLSLPNYLFGFYNYIYNVINKNSHIYDIHSSTRHSSRSY